MNDSKRRKGYHPKALGSLCATLKGADVRGGCEKGRFSGGRVVFADDDDDDDDDRLCMCVSRLNV